MCRDDLCVIYSIYKHDREQQLLMHHWGNGETDNDLRQHTHRHLLDTCGPSTLSISDKTRYGKGEGQTVYTTQWWYPVDDPNPECGWYRLQMTWLHLKHYDNPMAALSLAWGFQRQRLRLLPDFKTRRGIHIRPEPPGHLRTVKVDYGQILTPELWWTLPVARQPAPPRTPPPTPAPTFLPLLSCPPSTQAQDELDTNQDVTEVRFIAAAATCFEHDRRRSGCHSGAVHRSSICRSASDTTDKTTPYSAAPTQDDTSAIPHNDESAAGLRKTDDTRSFQDLKARCQEILRRGQYHGQSDASKWTKHKTRSVAPRETPGSSSTGPIWMDIREQARMTFHEARAKARPNRKPRTGGLMFWHCHRDGCGGMWWME